MKKIYLKIFTIVLGICFFSPSLFGLGWFPKKTNKTLSRLEKVYLETESVESLEKLANYTFNNNYTEKAVTYSKKLKTLKKDDVKALCLYASSLGKKAGQSKKLHDKVQLGNKSFTLLNECVDKFPDEVQPYVSRGISGVKAPQFLKRYKTSIKDFEKAMELIKAEKWSADKQGKIMPLIYYNYILALKMNDQTKKAKKVFEIFKTKYPDHKFLKEL